MTFNIFPSIGFTICGFVFLLFVAIMYLSKKKYESLGNDIYKFMIFLTIFLLILEFVYVISVASVDYLGLIQDTLARIYMLGCIIWLTCLVVYLWSLGKRDESEEKTKRYKKFITIAIIIFDSICFFISCFFPITHYSINKYMVVVGGEAANILYFVSFLAIIAVLFALLRRKSSLSMKQKIPFYFVFILFLIVTLIQMVTNYQFNDLTYIFAFGVVSIYFILESQDKKLIGELEKSKEEAIIADKAKTEFLTNMSHEIRTPMNTILGFSESLLKEEKLTPELVKKDTQSIYAASVNLLDLINNILDISRIESGKEAIEEKEYTLKNLIYEINSVISSKVNKEILNFKINVDNTLPSKLYGDYSKIYKILILVLVNAINHTNYGQVVLDITKENMTEESCTLKITISNSGHAMKIEDFEKDFNDFVKLGNSTQNNIDSTTLGLIIAKRLVAMLNGEINFQNETGKGTKYFVNITQKIIDNTEVGDIFSASLSKDEQNDILTDCVGKKVLIVDDNNVNIKLASKLLSGYNFVISSAQSGKECLELVKENKYDLIFLDHMMPEMDGITTVRLLKSSGYFVPPVIALTANSYDGLKDIYLKEGFSDYLSKPINTKELNKLLKKYFGSSKQ